MTVTYIIPAQGKNRFSAQGDLEPFGDNTLFQWKLEQLLDVVDPNEVVVTTDSDAIAKLAESVFVRAIKRKSAAFDETLKEAAAAVNSDWVVWCPVSAPFLSGERIAAMAQHLFLSKSNDSLVAVRPWNEYLFSDEGPLNFETDHYISRRELKPVYCTTNGCYVRKREALLKDGTLFGKSPYFYPVDDLESVEIKDVHALNVAQRLIQLYFTEQPG